MDYILIGILMIHGLIHLLGAVKAFSRSDLPDLTLSVSKKAGALWLLACLLFMIAAVMVFLDVKLWWAVGIGSTVLSQGLVISAWQDAKFATLPNFIILIVCIIAFAGWQFNREAESDITRVTASVGTTELNSPAQRVSEEMLADLPYAVRQWLTASGGVGKPHIQMVRLVQSGQMKTSPDQSSWSKTEAVQHINTAAPSFVWTVQMEMMPLVHVRGKDLFDDGEGHMLIRLYSLINVVNESGEKISRGALQRYLSEMVWYPSAALSDYVTWTAIDSASALATMTWGGLTEQVTFHFAEDGLVCAVSADRFMGGGDDAVRRPWRVDIIQTREVNGYLIPTDVEVSWELESGRFTWYRFNVTDIEYTF